MTDLIAQLQSLSEPERVEIIAQLSEAARGQLAGWLQNAPLIAPRANNAPQTLAYSIDADDIYYGGAAGGGKSFLIWMYALMQHDRSMIFRRNYQGFEEFQQIATHTMQRVGQDKCVTGGGTQPIIVRPKEHVRGIKAKQIRFCHMNNPLRDWKTYQGNTCDLQAWDEADQFPKWVIDKMQAWNRKTTGTPKGQRLRRVFTFNPPSSAEGLWIIEELSPWLDEKFHSKEIGGQQPSGTVLHKAVIRDVVYWFKEPKEITQDPKTGDQIEPIKTRSVVFIKALATDNPDQSEDYINNLRQMPESERQKYYLGNFSESLKDDAFSVVKKSAFVKTTNRHDQFERPKRIPDLVAIDPALTGDTLVATPLWIIPEISQAGCSGLYFGDQVEVEGEQIKGNIDRAINILLPEMPYLLNLPIVVDVLGPSGPITQDRIERIIKENGCSGYVIPFSGNQGTTWKSYIHPNADPKTAARRKFKNTISAAWITLGQRLEYDDCPYMFPSSNKLKTQLLSRQMKSIDANVMEMESKISYKDRLGYSPDNADSLVMAYWGAEYMLNAPKVNW